MKASKKFKLKRQYKTLIWVEYMCVLFFFIFLITTLIVRKHSDADWNKPIIMIPLLVAWFLPLFTGVICVTFAQFSRQELLRYKKNIQTYRARWFAIKAIEHLQDGKLQEAIDEYTKCNWYPEKSLDDYVYGMLVMAYYYSKDEGKHKIGIQRVNKLKERFDPNKIVFN